MESSENYVNYGTSWTAATNWTIAAGSLVNSLTFESSLPLISDEDNNDHHQISPDDSKSKSPLIIYAPTPDSAPCEITSKSSKLILLIFFYCKLFICYIFWESIFPPPKILVYLLFGHKDNEGKRKGWFEKKRGNRKLVFFFLWI
jgi:hypothetical protein